MATTYLIDFENVHELGMKGIHSLSNEDMVYIIYTENANRISLDCFNSICVPVSVIKVESGNQSLDMHLVSILGYLIGRENDPSESYVIISQDSHFSNISDYWCDRYNDDNKVIMLPSICGKPIHLSGTCSTPPYHDIAADRIRTLIRKQGVYGDCGRMMLVSSLCANMNEYPAYIKEKERLNLKGMKLLATFGDVIDIRQINNTDWAILKGSAFYQEVESIDENITDQDACKDDTEPEISSFDLPDIDIEHLFDESEETTEVQSADDECSLGEIGNEESDTSDNGSIFNEETSASSENQNPEFSESEYSETISEYNIRCRQILIDAAVDKGYTVEQANELASIAFSNLDHLYKRIDIYHSLLSKYGRVKGTEYYKVIKWMHFPEYTGDLSSTITYETEVGSGNENGSSSEADSPAISDSSSTSPIPELENIFEQHIEISSDDCIDSSPIEVQADKICEENISINISESTNSGSGEFLVDCPIESMGLPVRVNNALERAGLHYARQFVYLPDERLFKIRNLGKKGVTAIRDWVSAHMRDQSDY